MYDLKVLIAALSQSKKVNPFLWNLLVKGTKEHSNTKFEVHVRKSKRKITPFVGPNLPGVFLGKEEFSINEYQPPMVKPFRVAHANELFKQKFGQTIYGDTVTSQDLALDTIASELADLDDVITRKEILMLGELLSTGKMAIQGKGVSREAISYGTDPENFEELLGTDAWNDAGSDPLADMERWQMLVLKKTGLLIDSIILTPKAKKYFMDHEKVKEKLKYTESNVLRVQPRRLGDGASYLGTIPELNLDIYSYVDWYTNDAGEEVSILEDGGVLACKAKSVTLHYGAISQIAGESKARQIYIGKRIPKHWVDEDADLEKIRLAAAPLPVLDDADAIVFSKVVSGV
ncbi:major capsid protein [Ilyobacter polytropus]|jgi:hypothetical protein|uniref:Phage major capsid protein E n=1 Tax=Ilyobacter polytropus (strain ATCC 51220 / DSM 2926 / LMG 16218 / CuHBu1) TaxID=572544 RepID=E3H7C4_ILYPC|nr:major capsid protein [Ilyobacter polytropus]ADO82820.1 hypothetical protein Ilyop_1039 [Ilyobacter polytropus DSM 2926]